MRLRLGLLLLLAAAQASAQVGVGVGASPDLFAAAARKKRESRRAAPLAVALDQAFGPSVWEKVQVSTMGPVLEVTGLVKEGFFKLEIIEAVLLSAGASRSLRETVEKRRKGERLSEIAYDYRLDRDRLYEEALAVEEIVDKEYLPRLRERRFRRGLGDDSP